MAAKKNKKIVKKMPVKASMAGITPLADRILIRPFSADELVRATSFGIVIPETIDKEKPAEGEVVAMGEGKYIDGKLFPPKVKVGDHVVFSRYGYDEIKVAGKEYYILKEENILAIIQ